MGKRSSADTARLQSANQLNDAGLTEEDRAAKAGKLAAPDTDGCQAFRPGVLDLDGDGIACRIGRKSYRRKNLLSIHSYPELTANDPKHRLKNGGGTT